MTLDQDVIANIVYLALFGGVIGGAAVCFFSEVFVCLCSVLERSLERHSDRAGLVRACERLPGEGAQQHGKIGD